jgi:NAD dependent epimerase/dehydratase family enzyme
VKVVAAGMSGFLGTRLTRALHEAGHKVVRLVRSDATGPDESLWNPHSADLDSSVFDGADAVVNLCGPLPGFHRWSEDYKHRMLTSRVNPTRVLAGDCARLGIPGTRSWPTCACTGKPPWRRPAPRMCGW